MIADPREDIAHPIEVGQVYRDDRSGDELALIYIDKNIAVLRDRDDHHRLERRRDFDQSVGSGRFVLQPDADSFADTGRIGRVLSRADEYDGRGGRKSKHYAQALREAVSILTDSDSSDSNETVEFEEINGVGDTTAQSLRAAGYTTRGDIRRADDSELLELRGVGDANLQNIRNAVA